MAILKVARMGHPVLRKKARELTKSEIRQPSTQQFIDDMVDTMHEYHGVGLAAPQVHEGVRIFVAAIQPDDGEPLPPDSDPMVFINPVVTAVGSEMYEDWEGCLSIPDVRGRVPRARLIKVTALDRHGSPIEFSSHDFPGRVIQHETDHLDGVLFLDRMRNFDTLTFLDEYQRYWTKNDDKLQIANCKLQIADFRLQIADLSRPPVVISHYPHR
jgi:peptide deformylase